MLTVSISSKVPVSRLELTSSDSNHSVSLVTSEFEGHNCDHGYAAVNQGKSERIVPEVDNSNLGVNLHRLVRYF